MSIDPNFEAFVEERSAALLRLAYLLTGDRGHAEDLLQTALLRTARRWSRACKAPEAYTRQVLVNLSRDRIRRLRRRPAEAPLPVQHERYPSQDPWDSVGERRLVAGAVASLPIRQRQVVVLRFFADLSVEETANMLGCSPGTVKSYTFRALSRLREQLGTNDCPQGMEVSHDHVQ